MNNRPLAIDLFSGCGGMSLGLEAAGFDIAASVEIDPIHSLIHHYNFPYGATLCRDITQLSSQELLTKVRQFKSTEKSSKTVENFGDRKKNCSPEDMERENTIDLIAGGPPCQGFSTMGKRQFDDPRNQLIFEYVRLVKEIRPKYFIFENVPGLNTQKYRFFLEKLLDKFVDSGYSIVRPIRVLDASLYGAPQKRKRLIILGYRNDVPALKYPDPVVQEQTLTTFFTSVKSTIDDLSKVPVFIGKDRGIEAEKLNYLQFRNNFAPQPQGIYALCHQRANNGLIWGHLGSKHTKTSISRFAATIPGKKEPISHFFKLAPDGLSNTLRAGTSRERGAHTAPRPIHYEQPRCISIREAARLHTFPDWFQFHRTIWHGFREIGNAVIPLLAKHLGTEIMSHLEVDPSELKTRQLPAVDTSLLSYKMHQAADFWQVNREIIPKRKSKLKTGK